ncbi:tRNA uracil 4-sulfurtransferase ThiI [Saccharopolyspora cebuensis]|uniref:Probable tRNA sulfurtransferase n=1 Tax=Saccharopolyspora cebuensis TaxID=418759 RepID=A0ABV4CQ51_9PSEU
MAQPCVLLKHGEIAIKGRNRGTFERMLLGNLERAVAEVDPGAAVERRAGVSVLIGTVALDELVRRASEVIGFNLVQPALRVSKDPEDAASSAVRLLRERYPDAATRPRRFGVKPRRRDKNFRLTALELAAHIGQRVRDELGWTVDLDQPEVEITAEIDWREIFLSVDRLRGQGGLPVGASGRALVLLSGGYDSPVAAYRMMRRGLRCDFVHFTGAPFTGPSSTYKAYALMRSLDRFQGGSRLHVIPIGKAQRTLATSGAGQLQIVAQRRLIVRVGDALARRLGAQALVTGDSLGQVASQTLSNMATTEQATELPLLRPLLAWDKDEIMAEARRIGTYEVSELPDEDCCSLILPPSVATRTTDAQLSKVEERAGFDDMVEQVLSGVQLLDLGEQVRTGCAAPTG